MKKNLLIVLVCDVGLICALISYFWVDSALTGVTSILLQFGLLGAIILSTKLTKKYGANLDADQKKKRFVVTATGFVLFIGLVLVWAMRKNNALAWTVTTLTVIILSAILYSEWDRLNDDIKNSSLGKSGEANQIPQPTPPKGG